MRRSARDSEDSARKVNRRALFLGGAMTLDVAAAKALWLLAEARKLGATGVALKDEMPNHYRLT